MRDTFRRLGCALACSLLIAACGGADHGTAPAPTAAQLQAQVEAQLDTQLASTLQQHGFTGTVEQHLEDRLGRQLDTRLIILGGNLFFDKVAALHGDNACAGCHGPATGYADTQSIAIGIQSNLLVGPGRLGPRNQRRAPTVTNTAFYPTLMWDGRFYAPSGDPFDNARGFVFPQPEGSTAFPANDPVIKHLLIAQAYIPPTQLDEMAGFTGIRDGLDPMYYQFDDGQGDTCPALDASGYRNEPIRARLVQKLNAIPAYVQLFGTAFSEVKNGAPIDYSMVARAIAEFEMNLKGANAPIDRYARGETTALSDPQKRGALLFFGKANCVACHAVAGGANEMFSDFKMHNIGVPQIAPRFGVGSGNVVFDGPGKDEDYGRGDITGLASDRYKFRTSPLRNVSLQPTFFHNGAFTRLEDAIGYHLDVLGSLQRYDARQAGVAPDLAGHMAPAAYVAASIDPLLRRPTRLGAQEVADLVEFVRNGLLDTRMLPATICTHVPKSLPSGAANLSYQGCP